MENATAYQSAQSQAEGSTGTIVSSAMPSTPSPSHRHSLSQLITMLLTACTCVALLAAPYLLLRSRDRHAIRERRRRRLAGKGVVADEGQRGAKDSVQVLVLGDIGHSPRMTNHALSLAKMGLKVYIIGYVESAPQEELLNHPLIEILDLHPPPTCLSTAAHRSRLLLPLCLIAKATLQTLDLALLLLWESPATALLLVQNPPSFPTLLLAKLASLLRGPSLLIDWHNFGFSILALKLGATHPLVHLLRFFETRIARFAHAHFCVSNAMAATLRRDFHIGDGGGSSASVHVLYDRPSQSFQPLPATSEGASTRIAFLSSLAETTQYVQKLMDGRCALLVSSTSWTADEDFGVLIDALVTYSALATSTRDDLPFLGVVITGKGPLRQQYLDRVAMLSAEGRLDRVTVKSTWLDFGSYARLLACASLGICLHRSASGVDLPMKVLDMFGAGLPVVGWDRYESWGELVREGRDGLGFGSSKELAGILVRLFGGRMGELEGLREGARRQSCVRWEEEWERVARPVVRGLRGEGEVKRE